MRQGAFFLALSIMIVSIRAQFNPEQTANKETLEVYLGHISVGKAQLKRYHKVNSSAFVTGNISAAVTQMSETVQFRWNGPKALFPFAGRKTSFGINSFEAYFIQSGTYHGRSGVQNFFGLVSFLPVVFFR